MNNTPNLSIVPTGSLTQSRNANDPTDWVREAIEREQAELDRAQRLVDDAAAAEARARDFRLNFEKIRDSHKASVARLVASIAAK